jgi:ribonuclease HI
MSVRTLIEALEAIEERELSGPFVIRDSDIAEAALDAYRRTTISIKTKHVEEATFSPPAPLVRPTSPSERHSQ